MRVSPNVLLPLLIVTSMAECQAGFVAHWRFEEGTAGQAASGAGSILDSSGNGLHMTPRGNPTYTTDSAPGSNLAMAFDRVGDMAYRADSSQFQLQSLTIEAFVKYNGGGGLQQIFFRGDYRGGRDPYYLAINNGALRFNISDLSADRAIQSSTQLQVGQLLHVAATLDHATDIMKIFVDGNEVASGSAAGMRPNVGLINGRVSIGGLSDGFNYGQNFNGIIDEVRIADTALNPGQFLYNPVPEPSSFVVFGTLIGGLQLLRRRRRNRC